MFYPENWGVERFTSSLLLVKKMAFVTVNRIANMDDCYFWTRNIGSVQIGLSSRFIRLLNHPGVDTGWMLYPSMSFLFGSGLSHNEKKINIISVTMLRAIISIKHYVITRIRSIFAPDVVCTTSDRATRTLYGYGVVTGRMTPITRYTVYDWIRLVYGDMPWCLYHRFVNFLSHPPASPRFFSFSFPSVCLLSYFNSSLCHIARLSVYTFHASYFRSTVPKIPQRTPFWPFLPSQVVSCPAVHVKFLSEIQKIYTRTFVDFLDLLQELHLNDWARD